MLLRRSPNGARMMRLGMFSLIAGALALRFAIRIPGMTENLADGLAGLFYGAAIALLLIGIRARRRRPPAGA